MFVYDDTGTICDGQCKQQHPPARDGGGAEKLDGVSRRQAPPLTDSQELLRIEQCAHNVTMDCILEMVPVHPNHISDKDGQKGGCSPHVVFGAHHKTGTVLGMYLLHHLCPPGRRDNGERAEFQVHATPDHYRVGTPFVHFIRDPLEIVISGYQYHLVSDESWLKTPWYSIYSGYQKRLQRATLEDGLEMEYQRAKYDSIEESIAVHSLMMQQQQADDAGHGPSDFFTIRLEIMYNPFAFQTAIAALDKWLGANRKLSWEKLQRCCFVHEEERRSGADHVSKSGDKDVMRQIVMSRHGNEIRQFRRLLGYPLVGLEKG